MPEHYDDSREDEEIRNHRLEPLANSFDYFTRHILSLSVSFRFIFRYSEVVTTSVREINHNIYFPEAYVIIGREFIKICS